MYRAIVMRALGGPEVLRVEPQEPKPLAAGELRVKMVAAAVNHSDLDIRTGYSRIRRTPAFPYVPGLEIVGDVIEAAPDVRGIGIGQRVWTMMQGFGGVRAERDGGYAEQAIVAAEACAVLPADRDPVKLAAIGLAGVTAFEAMRTLGELRGKTVIVTGGSGGVGKLASQIAAALGATPIALGRADAPAPGSADAVLDVVGGARFGALVEALRPGGRYCAVGAAGGSAVTFDLWSLLDGRTLTGYSSEDLDGERLREATRAILAMDLDALPTVMSLADGARAHAGLEARTITGRVVLT